jgi:hypothetical protein
MNWPYQNTPYLSALPGVGGPGLDVSKGDLPSKIYFITSLENVKEGGPAPEYGPNCYAGTFWWVWYADQGEGFHKWVVPLVGGYSFAGKGLNTPDGRNNMDYVGHAAPGAGLILRCAGPRLRGSNMRIWHLPSWLGDEGDPDEFKVDQRDAQQASSTEFEVGKIAYINCEARFAMDESVETWYDTIGVSWIRGAIYDPLHTPPAFVIEGDDHHGPDNDHGYGALFGGKTDYALMMQSLNAHTTDRNPLVAAPWYAHINNLHYNHGRANVGRGAGVKIDDNGEHNADAGRQMRANIVGNVSVRGPNQNDDARTFVEVQDVTPGSTAHGAWNSVFGWEQPTTQDAFFWLKTTEPNYLQPMLRQGPWPVGLGWNYDGVLKPCRDPLAPTVREGLDFVQLMRETVGSMPARRYLYESGVARVLDQIDAAIRGVTPPGTQYANTVDEAGGWPELPTLTLDPAAPGQWHHEPMPLDENRDDVLLDGTFSDGTSKVGYSRLRAWVIEQHFFVMGR